MPEPQAMPEPPPGALAGFVAARGKSFVVAAGIIAVLVFAAIVTASVRKSPTLSGFLSGVAVGVFVSLLMLLVALWGMISLITPKQRAAPVDMAMAGELNTLLAPTIRELDAARAEVRMHVVRRAIIRVPLCVAGGLLFWLFAKYTNKKPPDIFDLFTFVGFGGLAGFVWASNKLAKAYRALYKQRVLPQLAARCGDLVYRPAQTFSVAALAQHHIFGEFDRLVAEDEIAGKYRNLRVSITALLLTSGSGDHRSVAFDGLLIEIVLPRNLSGTTAVITDEGKFGNFKRRLQRDALQPVRLEDSTFEARYEVYASDQVQARALLTPAFMTRLLSLADSGRFHLPGLLAEGNRLLVALPQHSGGSLFQVPSYLAPAGGTVLVDLVAAIENVLKIADTVIALDFFALSSRSQ